MHRTKPTGRTTQIKLCLLCAASLLFFGSASLGCSSPRGTGSATGSRSQDPLVSGQGASTSSDGAIDLPSAGGVPGQGGTSPNGVSIITQLPQGFEPADAEHPETSRGGYQVLGSIADVAAPEGECANILRVTVRDFQSTHDDFENAADWNFYDVLDPIGESRKPEKTSSNGPLHFEEWYRNIDGVNLTFAVDLWLEPTLDKFVYDSTSFFPLKDVGFMDTYLFTTELHSNFKYSGGEVFSFRGDDDVFVFVNGHLAVNLSGVHSAQEASVDLDAVADDFELELDKVYTFDLFQAERQPSGSNFRLETTLDFTGCGVILPSDIIR